MWNIESKEFSRKIDLAQQSATIKDCSFLSGFTYENKIAIVLTQEGSLDAYNVESGQLVASLNSTQISHNQSQMLNEQKPTQIYAPTNGHYFSLISQNGYIQVFDLDFSPLKSLKVG